MLFNEMIMPGIQLEEDTPVKCVELESQEEPATAEETNASNPLDNSAEQPITSNPDVTLRRSTRDKQKPERYGYYSTMVSTEQLQDPSSVAEAKSHPDKDQWEKAMEIEMESLWSNDVWELVEPPSNQRVVGSKWFFKRKVNEDGTIGII